MSLRHLALVYIICLVWGFNFIAVATGLREIPPFQFTVLRFAMVLLVLLPFIKRPPAGQWRRLTIVALANGAAHFTLLFWAMNRASDVSSVAILLQTYVPMTTLLAVFFLKEHIGWRTVSAIVLAFSGVLVVSLEPDVFAHLDAVFLCLITAFTLALGTMLMRGLKGIDAFSFQGWTAAISIPVLLPWMLIFEPQWPTLLATISPLAWGATAYSAVFASIIGHGLLFFLVQRYAVTSVTPHLLLAPVLAVIFGVIIWGDQPGWRLIIGGSMVLSGVLVVALRAKARTSVADTR